MSSHEVAPTDCSTDEKFWSFWKPASQAAPAPPKDASTTTTTPLKDEDAPVFLAPSSTLPLFFQTTATPYTPPECEGWKDTAECSVRNAVVALLIKVEKVSADAPPA